MVGRGDVDVELGVLQIARALPITPDRHRSGRSPADPCHTTVRTGPYTAVRTSFIAKTMMFPDCGKGARQGTASL